MMPFLKRFKFFYCLALLLLNTGTVACAQILTGSTQASVAPKPTFDSLLNRYGSNHKAPALYVHFDKNIYSSNETIWFAGYLLNANGPQIYSTLALALIKDEDRSVLMDGRFVINNGFCFGNATIPDSVNAGAYTLVAYGNRVSGGLPDVVFTQQITIKTGFQSTYNASLNPLDTSATGANQKVMLLVNFMDAKSAPKSVTVKYYVGDARKPAATGEVKTTNGQYIFNIPSAVLHANNNKLHVQVKHKAEVQDLSMVLPITPQPAQLLFFPEGGNVVNGVANTVGWELKNPDGTPIVASAVLFEDKQVLDTVHNNGSAMGRFTFISKKNKQYYLKLIDKNNTTYNLPPAVDGPALRVYRAVVNDTLIVDVHNDNPRRKLFLIGHNYRQTLFEAVMSGREVQRLKIILDAVPRGLLQLTLVDSLGRPYAERLVFAHYTNASKLQINTDNNSYNTRKKVSLSIKLNGEADAAAVSVAVVQANRVELRNKSDIENYMHLRQHLGDLPLRENFFSGDAFDRRDLEDVLLIKGWSRYKWTDVLRAGEEDVISTAKELTLSGKVTKLAGKFKEPVTLITLAPGGMYETDVNGFFTLPDSNTVTVLNKDIGIMVANNNAGYKITINNPYDSVSRALAFKINPISYNLPAQQSSADLRLSGNERAIQLKEVVIKDQKEDLFYYSNGSPKTEKIVINTCPDYVCQYGIHNCPNHVPPGCKLVITMGNTVSDEKPKNVVFKGIYAAQEFYPLDYSQTSPSQPEYLSTIYWKNQLLLKKGQAQEVSFYTSDITGQFKIIVQGITDDDVIYGEATFNVKK